MERYEQLEIEIIEIDTKDVICTSGGNRKINWEGDKDYPFALKNDSFDNGIRA